ncbi:energy transducer TonB family protein [Anaeromyxobacter terrae]|uniref:energy transducer TonB family protein n=1 Tax=Anaeromyxobacter terrae TaxID=2925406 RepID=UPI001F57ABA0|nr:hypothetical protein [Anaeromyxobacter sp. SG22]
MSVGGPERGSREARARERRWLLLAVGLSAALHAALLAALRPGPSAPPPPGPITVSLVEVEPGGETAGPPGRGQAERDARRAGEGARPGPEQRARPPAATIAPSRGAGPRERGARIAPQGELPPGAASAAQGWFDAQGLGGERRSGGRDALAVSPPASLFSRGDGAEEAPAARAKRRVDGMLAEMRARDLARYPDASWMDLRDALAGGFAPDFGVLRGGGQGVGDLLADTASAYLGAAEAYGRTGRPFANAPDAPGRVAPGKDAAVHAAAEGSRDREALAAGSDALAATGGKGLAQAWSKGLVTVVAVVEDEGGVVTDARVVASSGNPAHDRLALERARRLFGRTLSRRLAGTTTEWAFVTELSVIPPLPVAGVAFDANFKPKGLVYPLKRSAKSRIELVAVRGAG